MPPVYLILGLPGSGRREMIRHLVEDGLPDARAIRVYQAEADRPVAGGAPTAVPAVFPAVTTVEYTFSAGQFHADEGADGADEAPEPAAVFFLLDGRGPLVDQLEAFPGWLEGLGWSLARSLLVAHCDLAAAHPEVAAWHYAAAHFADVILLNRRGAGGEGWIRALRNHLAAERHPGQVVYVKHGRVDNAPEVLFPEARRLTHVFDPPDPTLQIEVATGEEKDEELLAELNAEENPPEPYFERKPSGHRRKPVPDVARFLGSIA